MNWARARHLRKVAKWTGAILCAVVVLAWGSSRWVHVYLRPRVEWTVFELDCLDGRIGVGAIWLPERRREDLSKTDPSLMRDFNRILRDAPTWTVVYSKPFERSW